MDERRTGSSSWACIALALPPAALAMRLDLASGFDAGPVFALAGLSLVLAVLLRLGAAGAACDVRSARLYAATWMVLVLGVPLLCAALERGGLPAYGSAPSWLSVVSQASPLTWIAHVMSVIAPSNSLTTGDVRSTLGSALFPLGLCIVLAVLGRRTAHSRAALEPVS